MYRLEYLNDHGDWIKHGEYRNRDNAENNAAVKEQAGYRTRITSTKKEKDYEEA